MKGLYAGVRIKKDQELEKIVWEREIHVEREPVS